MDERAARIIVVPGDATGCSPSAGRCATTRRCSESRRPSTAPAWPIKQLSVDEAEARRVEEVITFEDPAGTTLEVFHGAVLDHSPVVTPFGAKFVTGDQGLGHVVLPATRSQRAVRLLHRGTGFPFPRRVPGAAAAKSSARCGFGSSASTSDTTAWRSVPAAHQRDPGLVHIMVEVDTLDAVGQALDRVNAEGFQLSSTLGRHTNDKMVSFYVRAPGDWDIEFGTDGMRVDETYYTAEEITADSYWGHQWVGGPARGDAAVTDTDSADVTPMAAASVTSWDHEADVVIAGYGIAGAAAAVEAARLRRRRLGSGTHRILGRRGGDGRRLHLPRRRHRTAKGLRLRRFRRQHGGVPQRRDGAGRRREPDRRLLRRQRRPLRLAGRLRRAVQAGVLLASPAGNRWAIRA